jgi:uncharacterized repeat protein (TIGR01451 family)
MRRVGTVAASTILRLLIAHPAQAASGVDLDVEIAAPNALKVYQTGTYTVSVTNLGTAAANGVTVQIQLPATATATPYVLGQLDVIAPQCTLQGTRLNCTLGALAAGETRQTYFRLALPQSSAALDIVATASSAGTDDDASNNTVAHTAALAHYTVTAGASSASSRGCWSDKLSSYFECRRYPASIGGHTLALAANGSFSVPGEPGTSGRWSQGDAEHLTLQYFEGSTLLATFEGQGVSARCFEGITTYESDPILGITRICLP